MYRAEMIFDPLDPIGNIQFDSEAALSIKVSHTYSFRNCKPDAAPQPSSSASAAADSYLASIDVNSTAPLRATSSADSIIDG